MTTEISLSLSEESSPQEVWVIFQPPLDDLSQTALAKKFRGFSHAIDSNDKETTLSFSFAHIAGEPDAHAMGDMCETTLRALGREVLLRPEVQWVD